MEEATCIPKSRVSKFPLLSTILRFISFSPLVFSTGFIPKVLLQIVNECRHICMHEYENYCITYYKLALITVICLIHF